MSFVTKDEEVDSCEQTRKCVWHCYCDDMNSVTLRCLNEDCGEPMRIVIDPTDTEKKHRGICFAHYSYVNEGRECCQLEKTLVPEIEYVCKNQKCKQFDIPQ